RSSTEPRPSDAVEDDSFDLQAEHLHHIGDKFIAAAGTNSFDKSIVAVFFGACLADSLIFCVRLFSPGDSVGHRALINPSSRPQATWKVIRSTISPTGLRQLSMEGSAASPAEYQAGVTILYHYRVKTGSKE
ncbi:MAG TPA: hypothetical protein VFZ23_09930, partial [Pyrinomonadaceae bacterium]